MGNAMMDAIRDQTRRALWEAENAVACIPDHMWGREYCGQPLWKHVYHMLHSLDRWMINPAVYDEPSFHTPGLDDLDAVSAEALTRPQLEQYFLEVQEKITAYLADLSEDDLSAAPKDCGWDRFTLILAQHRHLHTHLGMIMGFLVAQTGRWPHVLGLTGEEPAPPAGLFFP